MKKDALIVVHYLNQFFGQQGGEDKADMPFMLTEKPVGPGTALRNILGEKGRVAATLICGDNYVAENLDKAAEEAFNLVAPLKPDLFFAGPAFEAGRYGMACGAICSMLHGLSLVGDVRPCPQQYPVCPAFPGSRRVRFHP